MNITLICLIIGALKIKEMCYLHAEGFSGGALKHGPFALIQGTCVQYLHVLNFNVGIFVFQWRADPGNIYFDFVLRAISFSFIACIRTLCHNHALTLTHSLTHTHSLPHPGAEGKHGQTPVIAIILDDDHAMHMRIAAEEVSVGVMEDNVISRQ